MTFLVVIFLKTDLSIYSHESIIKELFHVQDENENLKALSDQLVHFIEVETLITHDFRSYTKFVK